MTFIRVILLSATVIVAVLSVVIYTKFIKTTPSPVIQLQDGKIQGVEMRSREGRKYFAYYGIPYAEPPVGSLRFKPPVPSKRWNGIRPAASYPPLCAQFDYVMLHLQIGREDCLYLNVFVPENVSVKDKLPIVVYMHGGYFMLGTNLLAGADYFMDHNLIVVTVAYRVGALGFLNTGADEVIKANIGLRDQNLALIWIKNNIEAFNGDKTRVTISGESAGGASVHYHVLSPASKGLFSRAIRESGSALNYWTLYRNSRNQAKHFARKFNCPTEDSEKMADCLRELDVGVLLEGHIEMEEFNTSPLIAKFVPSIEPKNSVDAFLTEEPFELLRTGRFNKVPTLSGYNKDEGLLHSTGVWANETQRRQIEDWFIWAPRAFHYDPNRKDVSEKLRDFYFGTEETQINSLEDLAKITRLYSDRLFTVGVSQAALLEKKWITSYNYFFDYQGGFNFGTILAASQSKIHPILDIVWERILYLYTTFITGEEYKHTIPGTAHWDEFIYLWSNPAKFTYMDKQDIEMSKDLVQVWADFISAKNPLKFRKVEFLPSPTREGDELMFLRISSTDSKMIKEPYQKARLLWESFNLTEQ